MTSNDSSSIRLPYGVRGGRAVEVTHVPFTKRSRIPGAATRHVARLIGTFPASKERRTISFGVSWKNAGRSASAGGTYPPEIHSAPKAKHAALAIAASKDIFFVCLFMLIFY